MNTKNHIIRQKDRARALAVPRRSAPAYWLVLAMMLGLVLAVLTVAVPQANAADGLPTVRDLTRDAASNSFAPQTRVSLKQATVIARNHTGGRVLSANTKQRGTLVEYRVRMLVNGERVVTVTVDQNGEVRERR